MIMKNIFPNPTIRWTAASILMLLAFCYLLFFSKSETVPPNKDLSTFPKSTGQWVGAETFFDNQIYNVLGVDDSTLINYHSPDGKTLQLYVGYYQSQREGDIIHSPKNCLPGSGWLITRTSTEILKVPGSPAREIKVIKLLMEKNTSKQVVLYWFQSRGRFISSEYMQKIWFGIP
jgi:EpsI family protein